MWRDFGSIGNHYLYLISHPINMAMNPNIIRVKTMILPQSKNQPIKPKSKKIYASSKGSLRLLNHILYLQGGNNEYYKYPSIYVNTKKQEFAI
jgi:hypothetical protein